MKNLNKFKNSKLIPVYFQMRGIAMRCLTIATVNRKLPLSAAAHCLFLFSLAAFAQPIPFVHEFNLNDHKGQSYLSFMQNQVKPALDVLATDGYAVKGAEAMQRAYDNSDTKVKRKVDRDFGGLDRVKEIADALEGEIVTLETLPAKIRQQDRRVDAYGLATFIGLASGGGVSIKYHTNNYALNVHYDTVEERSGRSFGVGPTRPANDASDKDYLNDIQHYSGNNNEDLKDFYKAMFESLLNSDPSHYRRIEDEGQTVLTDFLAVFTAEQARNLMDGEVRPHWDAALLEVTLLAGFHAGQDEFKLYYKNPQTGEVSFTSETLKQTPCAVPERTQRASMKDYWQFSRNITNTEHCRRSGINITKGEFRLLEKQINSYVARNHPELLQNLQESMELNRTTRNIYEELSKYLISPRSARSLSEEKVDAITGAWLEFLNYVQENANEISLEIETN